MTLRRASSGLLARSAEPFLVGFLLLWLIPPCENAGMATVPRDELVL